MLIFFMSLIDNLERTTLEEIKGLDMSYLWHYARKNHEILNLLYENGVIKENNNLDLAFGSMAINTAKKDFSLIIRLGRYSNYADHVYFPECLAYAIQKGAFSRRELKKLKFDHGQNLNSFVKEYYNPNLFNELKEKLLNPIEISDSGSNVECLCCP